MRREELEKGETRVLLMNLNSFWDLYFRFQNIEDIQLLLFLTYISII